MGGAEGAEREKTVRLGTPWRSRGEERAADRDSRLERRLLGERERARCKLPSRPGGYFEAF